MTDPWPAYEPIPQPGHPRWEDLKARRHHLERKLTTDGLTLAEAEEYQRITRGMLAIVTRINEQLARPQPPDGAHLADEDHI